MLVVVRETDLAWFLGFGALVYLPFKGVGRQDGQGGKGGENSLDLNSI